MRTLSGPAPIVTVGRYGAGKILFQATDDTWRWRRHTGELLHDTYWVQLVRELAQRGSVLKDQRLILRTEQRTTHSVHRCASRSKSSTPNY